MFYVLQVLQHHSAVQCTAGIATSQRCSMYCRYCNITAMFYVLQVLQHHSAVQCTAGIVTSQRCFMYCRYCNITAMFNVLQGTAANTAVLKHRSYVQCTVGRNVFNLLQVRAELTSWAEYSSTGALCPTTPVSRSWRWPPQECVLAWSPDSYVCPTAVSPKSWTVTRRQAAFGQGSSAAVSPGLRRLRWSSASRNTRRRTRASSAGRSGTGELRRSVHRIVGNRPNRWTDLFSYCSRLIKDGLCDRSNAPSVSAISRLLRGRDGDDDKKLSDGEYTIRQYCMRHNRVPEAQHQSASTHPRSLLSSSTGPHKICLEWQQRKITFNLRGMCVRMKTERKVLDEKLVAVLINSVCDKSYSTARKCKMCTVYSWGFWWLRLHIPEKRRSHLHSRVLNVFFLIPQFLSKV